MALYKGLLKRGFKVVTTEKHFHDHDETWLILSGQGRAYWIDHAGQRTDRLAAAAPVRRGYARPGARDRVEAAAVRVVELARGTIQFKGGAHAAFLSIRPHSTSTRTPR